MSSISLVACPVQFVKNGQKVAVASEASSWKNEDIDKRWKQRAKRALDTYCLDIGTCVGDKSGALFRSTPIWVQSLFIVYRRA